MKKVYGRPRADRSWPTTRVVLGCFSLLMAFRGLWPVVYNGLEHKVAEGFFDLVRTGTSQSVQAAISNGADVNARDRYNKTPLMEAAEFNTNPEVIITLLDAGADLKARDDCGESPLMYAAEYNTNPEVITVLLKAGADVNAQDELGMTPLMYAAEENGPEMITVLLKAGADMNAKDYQEKTAFDYAQKNARLKGTDAYRQLQETSQ